MKNDLTWRALAVLVVFVAGWLLAACGDDKKEEKETEDVIADTAEPDAVEDLAAEIAGDPCEPNPCIEPPEATCLDGNQNATNYAETGTCSVNELGKAECEYAQTGQDCYAEEMVCEAGACIDPCEPNPCVEPPADECKADGTTQVAYAAPGACSVTEHGATECAYEPTETNCADDDKVCMEGHCVDADNPCDPNPCNQPPVDECVEDTLVTYPAEGTCVPGDEGITCEYQKFEADCAFDGLICFELACVDDPCEPDPCTDKPVAYCEDDGMTLVTYLDESACTVGEGGVAECEWTESSVDCFPLGACVGAECVKLGCDSHCDCQQGMKCINDECVLDLPLLFCCDNEECPFGESCTDLQGVEGVCGVSPGDYAGKIVFNEVLTDGSTDVDPNGGDEAGDAVEDEFIELVNVSGEEIAIGGFAIVEGTVPLVPRHTFAAGTTLGAGKALVVFGGGDAPDAIPGCFYLVSNAEDPGLPFGLSLNNDADSMKLLDEQGKLVAEFTYGPGQAVEPAFDESLTRSPDLTGDFVAHTQAAGSEGAIFSPCTKANGENF